MSSELACPANQHSKSTIKKKKAHKPLSTPYMCPPCLISIQSHSQKSGTVSAFLNHGRLTQEFKKIRSYFFGESVHISSVLTVVTRNAAFWESKMATNNYFAVFSCKTAPDPSHRGSQIPIFRLKKAAKLEDKLTILGL